MRRFKAENDLPEDSLFRFSFGISSKKCAWLYILAMKECFFIPTGYCSYIERVWLFFIAAGSFC